jgi:hypothetical protein
VKLRTIVEGQGEVSAIPVLLRRLRDEAGAYDVDIAPPIRRTRSDLVKERTLRIAVRLALKDPETRAVLIIFDADDDCPAELRRSIDAWAKAEAGPIACEIVIAAREYESWFVATMESLRGLRDIRADAVSLPFPEERRDAKGYVKSWMPPGRAYKETQDQPALTAKLDLPTAHRRSRSFRRMVRVFGVLAGLDSTVWPPSSWMEQHG